MSFSTASDIHADFVDSQNDSNIQNRSVCKDQFKKDLRQVTIRILDTKDFNQLLSDVTPDICKLFNTERMSLYIINAEKTHIGTRLKTGLNFHQEIKAPITSRSIAGFIASCSNLVNISDSYDSKTLKNIYSNFKSINHSEKSKNLQPKQMLIAPVVNGTNVLAVLQIINNKNNQSFGEIEENGLKQLCKTLGPHIQMIEGKLPSLYRQNNGDQPISNIESKTIPESRYKKTKYAELVVNGVITENDLALCYEQSLNDSQLVESLLIQTFCIDPIAIGASLAYFFGVKYEPFYEGRIRTEILHAALKRDFIESQGWLPLEDSADGLIIMCLDPEAARGARVIPQVFPRIRKFVYRVTTQAEFNQTLDQLYGEEVQIGSIDQLLADMDLAPFEDEVNNCLESAAADNELVKFVNKVIIDAYHQKVSDIHIEPMPGKLKTGIRFRIDGTLQPYIEVPAHFRQAMVTRLKIMCDLDISERRKPQDGKIKFKKYGPLDIELRVATIPSAGGVEDVVMRILAGGEPIPLDKLGLTPHNKERVLRTIEKPYGLFYVCGPTGSGKTTTLHSILKHLNTPETKIWTAEDPVEITQKGLRQVQINRKAGIDFALVMRAFLRADPDIIMVGESRDKETVAMGVEASLTGHLVFSTLHTNSAPESITRLLDMGMDPFNFADALLGILAQRLAKKLCDCKESYVPDAEELRLFVAEYADELRHSAAWKTDYEGETRRLIESWHKVYDQDGQLRFYRHVGCDKCNKTGYKGRIGLHELLIASDDIKKLIQERARVAEIFAAAVEGGMRTLKMDGMEKIMQGLTDIKMVRQVCIK